MKNVVINGHLLKQEWLDDSRQTLKLTVQAKNRIVEVRLDNVEVPIGFMSAPKSKPDKTEAILDNYHPEEVLKKDLDITLIGASYSEKMLILPELKADNASNKETQEVEEGYTGEELYHNNLGE